MFVGLYYSNVWRAKDFPFLSQLLFSPESNSTLYVTYNQTAILSADGRLDEAALATQGIPYMAASFAAYVLTQNMAITATITHLCLYNWDDLKSSWSFISVDAFKSLAKPETWRFWKTVPPTEEEIEAMDPHYKLMQKYEDCPNWWYGMVFVVAGAIGLICIYEAKSGMKWWAFIVAIILASVLILFTGAQFGLTGFNLPVQPIIQMIGAYLEPGNPLTNVGFLKTSWVFILMTF